jgi:hypothetical protein
MPRLSRSPGRMAPSRSAAGQLRCASTAECPDGLPLGAQLIAKAPGASPEGLPGVAGEGQRRGACRCAGARCEDFARSPDSRFAPARSWPTPVSRGRYAADVRRPGTEERRFPGQVAGAGAVGRPVVDMLCRANGAVRSAARRATRSLRRT